MISFSRRAKIIQQQQKRPIMSEPVLAPFNTYVQIYTELSFLFYRNLGLSKMRTKFEDQKRGISGRECGSCVLDGYTFNVDWLWITHQLDILRASLYMCSRLTIIFCFNYPSWHLFWRSPISTPYLFIPRNAMRTIRWRHCMFFCL